MNFLNKILILLFIFLFSACVNNTNTRSKHKPDKIFHSSSGFALLYDESYYDEKKYYSEALIYCYKQYIISRKMDISKEKIDQWAMELYSATEDGLKYDDILKKMYVKIINSGKKTYKEGAGGLCVDAMLKIWKDKSIQIESPIKKNVKNFFQKLF